MIRKIRFVTKGVGLNNRRNLGLNNCCIASIVYNKRNMPESSAIRLTKRIS